MSSLVAVAVALVLLALVVRFASRQPDRVNLGDNVFVVGRASRFADRIAEQRTPILFKDPLTSRPGREVYVQHLGDDHEKGWSAIEAYAPGVPREVRCILKWEVGSQEFVDPCGSSRFPADGTGLRVYRAIVDKRGAVVIDLRTANGVPTS